MLTGTKAKGNGAAEYPRTDDMPLVEEAPAAVIRVQKIAAETILVPILGTSPLIVHRFSEKAKQQMLDAMQGRRSLKEPKNPEAEYMGAFYRLPDGTPGVQVSAFKEALVGAARFFGRDVTMTTLRQCVFCRGEIGTDGFALARIVGDVRMREDVVRVGRGGTDLRYRPEFPQWSTTLTIIYIPSMLTRESVLALLDAGGMGVGICEWRPERHGTFGCFTIDPEKKVEVIS